MGEVDYNQIYSLQNQVNADYSSISSAQFRITSIDEQLERLRTAKKSVSKIQRNVHDIRYPINHRNIQSDWHGKQKDAFLFKYSGSQNVGWFGHSYVRERTTYAVNRYEGTFLR